MKLTTVLLDFGGTLDGPGVHWSTQFARAFGTAGARHTRRELDQAFLRSEALLAETRLPRDWDLGTYVRHQAALIATALGLTTPVADLAAASFLAEAETHLARAAETLRAHASVFRYGLVSNFPETLLAIVERAGLRDLFADVAISEVENVRKPDRRLYERVLARLGVRPEETAMVGDSLKNDVQGAKAAGLACAVWLKGDEAFGGGDPASADAVVSTLDEAFAWLRGRA